MTRVQELFPDDHTLAGKLAGLARGIQRLCPSGTPGLPAAVLFVV